MAFLILFHLLFVNELLLLVVQFRCCGIKIKQTVLDIDDIDHDEDLEVAIASMKPSSPNFVALENTSPATDSETPADEPEQPQEKK